MRIGNETAQRVLPAARELNYRPNLAGPQPADESDPDHRIHFRCHCHRDLAHDAIRGALATAPRRQHLLLVGETEADPEVDPNLVQAMFHRGVSGFVHGSMYTNVVSLSLSVSLSEVLRDQPLVLMNCLARNAAGSAAVLPDERRDGRDAAELLLAAGHDAGIVILGETPEHG